MNEYTHALIIIVVMGVVTMATRLLPVLLFSHNDNIPDWVLYLGRVVPYTAMGLLIVYCLKDVSVFSGSHGLPEIISLAVVSITYLWKRNTILSVVVGTVLYMALVQGVF